MISDTLFEAVNEIDEYLNDDGAGFYSEQRFRTWILSVRDSMEHLRCVCDQHPDGSIPPFRPFNGLSHL